MFRRLSVPRMTATVVLILIATILWRATASASRPITAVSIYDPDPTHILNRLYAALFVRQDATGQIFNADSLDPALPEFSRHLLERDSHRYAIRVLDEFLNTHAENLIRDPLKRALFNRDLWAVFDWSVARRPMRPREPSYAIEKKELQVRLAEILRRLSLTDDQIAALPDNYAESVNSGEFPKEFDPSQPDRVFLPPDLFDPHGPWVPIRGFDKPPAPSHVTFFSGRSRFLALVRLPGGRKATYDYFRQLWEFPQPASNNDGPQGPDFNPNLPSFPPGTEVALVRQMTMFDDHGNLVPVPITESIQIRMYRSVAPSNAPTNSLPAALEASGQKFYEMRLDREMLFAGRAGGLREVARNEKEIFVFNAIGFDLLDSPKTKIDRRRATPIMQECVWCHREPGIQSLNSRTALLTPNPPQSDDPSLDAARCWEQDGTLAWKKNREDWGLLSNDWKNVTRH
jgi:hypothetical protein